VDYRAARGDVEVEVRARVNLSSPGVELEVFPDPESAKVGALRMCSAAARAALVNYASDVRLKQMMGEPCPIGIASGGASQGISGPCRHYSSFQPALENPCVREITYLRQPSILQV